jgi:hypothetical protein
MNHKFWNAGVGKPEGVTHAVKNLEAVKILAGTAVVFAMNGTDDGLGVVNPSTLPANVNNFTAGLTTKDIEPGKLGEVQVYGFFRKAALARATRANTTTAWPTMASLALGVPLNVDTVLNGIASGGGSSMANNPLILAEAVAAGPTLGSSAGSGTVYNQGVKVFLRFM